jgi:hypothetical protein
MIRLTRDCTPPFHCRAEAFCIKGVCKIIKAEFSQAFVGISDDHIPLRSLPQSCPRDFVLCHLLCCLGGDERSHPILPGFASFGRDANGAPRGCTGRAEFASTDSHKDACRSRRRARHLHKADARGRSPHGTRSYSLELPNPAVRGILSWTCGFFLCGRSRIRFSQIRA